MVGKLHQISVPASLSVIGRFSPLTTDQPSLDAGKIDMNLHVLGGFWYGISGLQAGSCKRFHGQNRRFRASEEGYWEGSLELVG